MKTKLLVISLLVILTYSSCSDDESITESNLTTEDLNITVLERPDANLSLGTINATAPLEDINYSIVSQTVESALVIDQNTGEVFVNNSDAFDINDTELIEAQVEVLAGDAVKFSNVAVNLKLPEVTIDYFKEIALGFENGNSTEITRKWNSTMKIYLDGNPSSELVEKVEQTVADINELATDGFSIEIVESENQSNCYIFFGTASEFTSRFPDAQIGSNFAIFYVWWNNNIINRAQIFIDTDRPTLSQQKSLILEEVTQVLGLGKDSPRFPGSIFFETSNNGGFATEYSDLDRELVRLLYHPWMKVNKNDVQTEALLIDILKSEW